jgi:eukaryotic-like serine/threonine-protein kinase
MSLRKYLTSPIFFGQILIALVIIAGIGFFFINWLGYATNHGDVRIVPNLSKLSEDQVNDKLSDLDLEAVMLDTIDYNPAYPKASVVEQDPLPGSEVKEGRKVYIKLNASGYAYIKLPNLIQQTYRQALPTLKALGLNEGLITYLPDIGKDMVLEMKLNGKPIKPGEKVMKSSKIDLVLGDGKIGYEEEVDSLGMPIPNTEDLKPTDEQ